jgi:hypothetical protein
MTYNSLIRDVPDNQESFTLLPGDHQTTSPESLTFELLERVTDQDSDLAALKYHVLDILDPGDTFYVLHESLLSDVEIRSQAPLKSSVSLLQIAVHSPPKGSLAAVPASSAVNGESSRAQTSAKADATATLPPPADLTSLSPPPPSTPLSALLTVALIRLPEQGTDFLISWSYSLVDVISKDGAEKGGTYGGLDPETGAEVQKQLVVSARTVVERILAELEIRDLGLFGE